MPILDLDVWYNTTTYDVAIIEYTTDQGWGSYVNWTTLGSIGYGQNWYNSPSGYPESGWNGSSGGWIHSFHTLDSLGGEPYVIFRIRFIGGVNSTGEGFAFDNFRISESPVNDIEVESIQYPLSNCGLSATDSVIVKIKNHGFSSQHDFQVKYSIDGGLNYVTETVADTIDFLQSINYKFVIPADFSNQGVYHIIATTTLPADQIIANDSAFSEIMSYINVSTFPYVQGFESDNGSWYAYGLNSSWEWGIPNDTVLTSAGTGIKCWATNLSGYHNLAEHSYINSPCFDLSSMLNPRLKMKVWYDEDVTSYCQFLVSNDEAVYFDVLDTLAGSDWYNGTLSWIQNSLGWKQVSHTLKEYSGDADVRFQFYFQGLIQKSGFAFDDFEICDAPLASFTDDVSLYGYQVKFNNSSAGMDSCLWNFGDGSFSNLINPTHLFADSDSVLVTLYAYNSCGMDSSKKWVHPKFINVPVTDLDKFVKIYPIPAVNELNLEVNDARGTINIEISDIHGKCIIRKQYFVKTATSYKIPLKDMASGIYFVRITDNKGTINRKLVKN